MLNRENFPVIFEQLKAILHSFEPPLVVQADTPDNYTLEVSASLKYPKGFFFGSVRQGKNYVSYHLIALYMFPDLLEGMSERLKKRMQGKSCFNFTAIDEAYITELTQLTQALLEADVPRQSEIKACLL